jgi:rsbT co-antagonist protein RsbR
VSVEDESAAVRRRIEELEQKLSTSEQKLRLLISVTNEAMAILDQGIVVDVSDEQEALLGYKREEVIGQSPAVFVAPESRERLLRAMREGIETPYEVTVIRKDGTSFLAQVRGKTAHHQGRSLRVAAIRDVTAARRAKEVQRATAVQEELIRAQAAMLAQLSTPLLPISDRVVVLPLIGEVNEARASQVIETLTRGVFTHRAAIAILDITGTTVVGTQVADMLVRAARVVQLLGAQVILTGIRPEVAADLVDLGTDLGGIITRGTLQQGVTYALTRAGGRR